MKWSSNSNITMNIYTHAVSSKRRRAQCKVVEMILREEKTTPGAAGVSRQFSKSRLTLLE
jgi:hypothetical protein